MPKGSIRIATNCVGQHIVIGPLTTYDRRVLVRSGWLWSRNLKSGGNWFTTDTTLAERTANHLALTFDRTPRLREAQP